MAQQCARRGAGVILLVKDDEVEDARYDEQTQWNFYTYYPLYISNAITEKAIGDYCREPSISSQNCPAVVSAA